MDASTAHRPSSATTLGYNGSRRSLEWSAAAAPASGTHVRIPGDLVRAAYWAIFAVDAILIVVTFFWELDVAMPRGAGQLDLRAEARAAVWYSSMLLMLNGVMALVVGFTATTARSRVSSAAYRAAWLAVAAVFAGLSLDETLEIHERIGRWFHAEVMAVPALIDVYAWVLVLLPMIALFVMVVIVLIRQVLAANRLSRHLASAALACWIGVIVAETVEAQMMRIQNYRSVMGTIEEGLEIVGASLFLVAFCEFLRRRDDEPATPA